MPITHVAKPANTRLFSPEWNANHIGTLDHTTDLTNVGVNTHAQIDTFISVTVPTTYLKIDCSNDPLTGVLGSNFGCFFKDVVAFGNQIVAINPDCACHIYHEKSGVGDFTGQVVTLRLMDAIGVGFYPTAIRYEINLWSNVGLHDYVYGVHGEVNIIGNLNVNRARGITGGIHKTGSGLLNNAIGFRPSFFQSAGTTTMVALQGTYAHISGGAVDVMALYWAENPLVDGPGVLNTLYGFYMPNLTAAGVNWGFYQAGVQPNYFAGRFESNLDVRTNTNFNVGGVAGITQGVVITDAAGVHTFTFTGGILTNYTLV